MVYLHEEKGLEQMNDHCFLNEKHVFNEQITCSECNLGTTTIEFTKLMVFSCISSHGLDIAVLEVLANVVEVHDRWLALPKSLSRGLRMEAHYGCCHQHCFEREAPFSSENKANVDVGESHEGLCWGRC